MPSYHSLSTEFDIRMSKRSEQRHNANGCLQAGVNNTLNTRDRPRSPQSKIDTSG